MAEHRRFGISAGMLVSAGAGQVIEHDMDMKRSKPHQSAVNSRLAELMRSHPHDMTRAAHPSASLFSTWNAISLLKSSAL